jgi:hypothetical protein
VLGYSGSGLPRLCRKARSGVGRGGRLAGSSLVYHRSSICDGAVSRMQARNLVP